MCTISIYLCAVLGPGTEYAGTTIGPDVDGNVCFEYDWGA